MVAVLRDTDRNQAVDTLVAGTFRVVVNDSPV